MSSYYRINYHLRAHKRDPFIEFIKGMLLTPFVLHVKPPPAHMSNQARYAEIMGNIEELIDEHREMDARGLGNHSRLRRVVPTVGTFFTQLPLREAFVAIDKRHSISARKFVPPSFNDIRRVLNTAQVRAVAPTLRLITFDGDMTLYEDGADFDKDNALVQQLIALLEHDLHVAIVTAAAYGDNAALYERRLSGLLHGFRAHGLSGERAKRFYVMGGECNYLLQCQPDFSFRFIDESTYSPSLKQGWAEDAMQAMIDKAEACM
ncbi:IMP-specific 5-nucleotidase, partial [Ramicandelaber brevisporus]